MRPQTLISINTALFLGLMTVVFTGTEAAPVKVQSMQTKSAKSAVAQTARINIVKAVLKPARTKGKFTLKITLYNPTATKATAFTVKALHQRRVIGKTNLNGLNPRARISRTLRNLPQQKGQRCVTVRLTKPRNSKLKLGTPRRVCLTSSVIIGRGIDTSPSRKVGAQGKLRNKPRIGAKGATRTVKRKGRKRLGKYTRKGFSGIKYALGPGSLTVSINNGPESTGPVTANPGDFIIPHWNLSSADNPNNTGIYLLISDVSGTDGNCAATAPYLSTALGSNDEGHKAGTPFGSYTLSDLTNFQVGRTYYLKGCLWNLGGNPEYSGEETNVVRVRYEEKVGSATPVDPGDVTVETPKPDLVITKLEVRDIRANEGPIYSKQYRFKVKNLGPATFSGNMVIEYVARYRFPAHGGAEFASGASAPRSVTLRPNNETSTIWGHRYRQVGTESVLRVCVKGIRSSQTPIPEADTNNNCMQKYVPTTLPDFVVTEAWIKMGTTQLFPPNIKPIINVKIRNSGKGPAFGKYKIRAWAHSQPGRAGRQLGYWERTVAKTNFEVGQTRTVRIPVSVNQPNAYFTVNVNPDLNFSGIIELDYRNNTASDFTLLAPFKRKYGGERQRQ